MGKRKSSSVTAQTTIINSELRHAVANEDTGAPPAKRRASARKVATPKFPNKLTNPDENEDVLDAPEALRASPDATAQDERLNVEKSGINAKAQIKSEELPANATKGKGSKKPAKGKDGGKNSSEQVVKEDEPEREAVDLLTKIKHKDWEFLDPEADDDDEADEQELKAALSRPPPVNSDYLPLPWKGRLGYACLNTYLRFSNPPVFSSRTCRIASIIENRYPLTHPDEPPHATKNRPDRTKTPDVRRGQAFVESLGKANARDIVKMLRWNDKYGIKFLRLSSEMFPFASHVEYGYKLAPFVSEELAEAGRVAAELGHRLTTHPGQYTQLGSPRQQVIDNAIRDLDYHAELLSLLKLPPQQDRDAVMILHLGGVFGDKAATLDRFRENYAKLSDDVKKRLVLENDDVSWSVHDLLPICEELNIPMVLDFHHNNIVFDADQIREGTKDIVDVFPQILATWRRKNITPKMHYSEPTPAAITGRQRRKHNPRVATLPPCPPDMDLMIEAKDKEQAVFELMRTFKLPGYDTFNDIIPHVRQDDNRAFDAAINKKKRKTPKKAKSAVPEEDDKEGLEENSDLQPIPDEDVGMGGPENRVYWPPGMEEWLRPAKRVVKPKAEAVDADADDAASTKASTAPKKRKAAAAVSAAEQTGKDDEVANVPDQKVKTPADVVKKGGSKKKTAPTENSSATKKANASPARAKGKGRSAKTVPTPSTSDDDEDVDDDIDMDDLEDEDEDHDTPAPAKGRKTKIVAGSTGDAMAKVNAKAKRQSGRAKKAVAYAESGQEDD